MSAQHDHRLRQRCGKALCVTRTNTLKGIPKGTESILFVDDEASLAKVGANLLERIGYRVKACNSGTEALDLFKADPNR